VVEARGGNGTGIRLDLGALPEVVASNGLGT